MNKLLLKDPKNSACVDVVSSVGDYLTRDEALAFLGVKQQTLYSYVSRGFIRSVPRPNGRSSYYPREDVLKLRAKSDAHSGHGPVAASAMRWGEPVIETGVTEITDQGPRYRNRLAVELARQHYSFENVTEFLWGGSLSEEPIVWTGLSLPSRFSQLLKESASLRDHPRFLQLLAAATVALGIAAGSRRDRILAGVTPAQTARNLILALVGVFGFLGKHRNYACPDEGGSVAHGVLRALGVRSTDERLQALNAALVLVADHELNPATFAARIAASCGGDMHACVGAAINTHYGSQIGCACDRFEQLLGPACSSDEIVVRASKLRAAGRKLPGFDHHLYPAGDPRALALVEIAKSIGGAGTKRMLEVLTRLEDEFGTYPSVEGGIVVICRALGIPNGGANGLYALGRCAGWIAHIMEQRDAAFMIRPRAKFLSLEPSSNAIPHPLDFNPLHEGAETKLTTYRA